MKKVTSIVLALTMLLLFALISSCENQIFPTENNQISARESLYRIGTVGEPCETFSRTLWAGQNIDVGEIIIEEDGTNFTVMYKLHENSEWCITETHLHVAILAKDIPQTKQGNLIPGQFEYKKEHDCVTEYTYGPFPIPGVYNCDDDIDFVVAAHAVVEKVITITPAPYYASAVVSSTQGLRRDDTPVNTNRSVPEQGLYYETDRNPENFFSLGFGGEIIVEFDCPIVNGEGNDVRIIEDTWGTYPLEEAQVWASKTLVALDWVLLGVADNKTRDPLYNIHTIAEFDLGGLDWAKYIKIVDIGDPALFNSIPDADGYDLNAVESLQDCEGIEEETAWGEGEKLGKNWSMVMGYDICCPACDEWILYGSNLNSGTAEFDDALYAYDLKNQTQTLIYDPTPIDASQNYPNANAYDPVNQRIYFGTDDGRLYYHQIGSGTHVQVEGGATSGTFGTMACGSWYDGKYYYVQNSTNRLYVVDIVADVATRTQLGTVPVSVGYGDIAFDPANPGRFIGSGNGKWYWYDVNDKSSATMTESGGDGAHKQLAYGSDGVLYGVNAGSGQFYTIIYDGTTVTLTLDWDSPYTFTDLASGPQCQ